MTAMITWSTKAKVQPELKKKAYAFLEKLGQDDTAPGLHIEPIFGSADPRVRTGRVDQGFRAVLHKLSLGAATLYVFNGIWPHDEANEIAKRLCLKNNPVNGITELTFDDDSHEPDADGHQSLANAVIEPEPSLLGGMGHDIVGLRDELGLDPRISEAAMKAADETTLYAVANGAPEWQQLAIIALASGDSIPKIKEDLGISSEPVEQQMTEDEQIAAGLQHPAAKISFAYIEDSEELRRIIEEGDFGAWRIFLHPEQRKYAERTYNGPFRLSGGAGTGKTVVVLHRARELAKRDPDARILVTTFTKNLAQDMRAGMERLDPDLNLAGSLGDIGVFVAGIDSVAASILKGAGVDISVDVEAVLGLGANSVRVRAENRWKEALDRAGANLPESLRSPAFMSTEYAMVILPKGATTREAYYKVRRPGRVIPLDRAKRSAVWDVVEAYRAEARIAGSVDFTEAATIAAAHLRRVASSENRYAVDRVLVDEGQDLTPAHWQLLRALVDEHPNDLFIAEDSHQRIYGHRVVLSQFGIRIVGRSQRLTLNYRTTAQNLDYAMTVLESGDFVDLENDPEKLSGYRSARTGPNPRFIKCASLSEELDRAAELIREWTAEATESEAIAILVRDRFQRQRVVSGLAERDVKVRSVDRELVGHGAPVVMTMHRAKGMEFSRVLLFGIDTKSIPAALRDEKYDETAWKDAILRERSLLYVAATRARDHLALSWNGQQSELLRGSDGS